MRTIKFIAGLGCFILALLPGGLALLVFSKIGIRFNIVEFCYALIPAALAASLICAGGFLIARRNSSLSRKARLLIALPVFFTGLLAVVAVSDIMRPQGSCSNACINNLREIDAAAQEFALENKKRTGDAINFPDDLTPYIKLNKDGKIPSCPQGGIYSIKKVGDTPTCSLGTNGNWAHVLP